MNIIPIYELSNVKKNYAQKKVLDKINIKIFEGEMLAIIGKSGTGKTTLLNILGMLEDPDEGEINFFGKSYPKKGSKERTQILRNKVSYLFQNYALVENDTVDNNLNISLTYINKSKKEKTELKIEALKRVGLNISLKTKVYELSGGEQQRLSLARVFLKPCEIILADEPTGSLDNFNRDFVIESLKELNKKGKTIIIVTHDFVVAEQCSRIIEL